MSPAALPEHEPSTVEVNKSSTSERKLIFSHALTVWVGQLAVMSFGITDTVVAGRFSEHALATLSIGSAFYITVYVALMGL